MTLTTTREQRRQLARENAKQPSALREVPRDEWPDQGAPQLRVWRSREFLVQEFSANAPAMVRLSVCRTIVAGDRWQDGITWDELQRIKRECGYGDFDAVEVFPSDWNVVNVANMRHLWVMHEPLKFAWRNGGGAVLMRATGMLALGRLKAGAMNKTEAAYAELLDARVRDGDVLWYRFEGLKLRLADNTFYTPDFAVMRSCGLIECHEVKGHWMDDARAKIKIAAEMYPFRFLAVKVRPKKAGGGWDVEAFE